MGTGHWALVAVRWAMAGGEHEVNVVLHEVFDLLSTILYAKLINIFRVTNYSITIIERYYFIDFSNIALHL